MTVSPGHLSILTLERLAAKDMPQLAAEAAHHLEECSVCQARYARISGAHAQFAAEVDVPARIDDILRAANAKPRFARLPWVVATCGFAVAAAAVVLVSIGRKPQDATLDGRLKGSGDVLEVLRRSPDGNSTVLNWGDSVHPGDAIRFRVKLRKDAYVGVLGIDAAQAITAYAPGGEALERVGGGAPQLLDGGVVLDDTLGAERIVLAVCDSARATAEVIEEARVALARAKGDPAKMGAATRCREQALLIEKVAR